jgi:hypothetical protein
VSYSYNLSILTDILSKREFLYRQYFLNKGYTTYLPKYFIASPTNPIIDEVKASYPFIDPSVFSSEISRDYFYQNSNFVTMKI